VRCDDAGKFPLAGAILRWRNRDILAFIGRKGTA
jgi:hypothetical protein